MNPDEAAFEISGIWDAEWFTDADRERFERTAQSIPDSTKTVLDVGCGNGMFLHYLKDQNRGFTRLCGTDRSREALSRVQVEHTVASADQLPFHDREFEVVTCLEVIEHLPVNAYQQSLAELARVSSEYVIISVPYNQDLKSTLVECPACTCCFNADYHVRSFTESTLNHLLDSHGFVCDKLFHISETKTIPPTLRRFIQAVRALKHSQQKPSVIRYPWFAVCPACGFQKPRASGQKTSSPQMQLNSWGKLTRTFALSKSYRWIAGRFKRVGRR